jgi:hypothetical protein
MSEPAPTKKFRPALSAKDADGEPVEDGDYLEFSSTDEEKEKTQQNEGEDSDQHLEDEDVSDNLSENLDEFEKSISGK